MARVMITEMTSRVTASADQSSTDSAGPCATCAPPNTPSRPANAVNHGKPASPGGPNQSNDPNRHASTMLGSNPRDVITQKTLRSAEVNAGAHPKPCTPEQHNTHPRTTCRQTEHPRRGQLRKKEAS